MNNNFREDYQEYRDYLMHSGVKGMKWGRRRSNRSYGHDSNPYPPFTDEWYQYEEDAINAVLEAQDHNFATSTVGTSYTHDVNPNKTNSSRAAIKNMRSRQANQDENTRLNKTNSSRAAIKNMRSNASDIYVPYPSDRKRRHK